MHGHELGNIFALLAFFLFGARVLGRIASLCKLPSVLGELGFGMLLAAVFSVAGFTLPSKDTFSFFSELGVLLLLFEVGLETSVGEIRKVGLRAAMVAVVGVALPTALGFLVSLVFIPEGSWIKHLFVGAALAATSVGITARVMKELGKNRSPESSIILGAAVIDDVLGLILLGLVSAVAGAGGNVSELGASLLLLPLGKAILYLALAFGAGHFLVPAFLRVGKNLLGDGGLLVTALSLCLLYSFGAERFGLAPAIGAFFAGMVIHTGEGREGNGLEKYLHSLVLIFVPLFFVLTGLAVDIFSFLQGPVLLFSLVLCAAAVVGKVACGFLAGKGPNPWIVGVGMVPRGEVGLIFASIGAGLKVGGEPLLSPSTYGAVVAMVAFTTFLAPVWLSRLYKK